MPQQVVDVAAQHRVAVVVASTPWGGAPTLAGAGDGVETASCAIPPNVESVKNDAKYGATHRRAGSAGKRTPVVDLKCDVYYRDAGAHRLLGQGIGKDTVSGAGPYTHDLSLGTPADRRGRSVGIVDAGPVDVREVSHAKVGKLALSVSESQQRASLAVTAPAFDVAHNVGGSTPAAIVASVTPANGALTVVPMTHPAALVVAVVDGDTSITELLIDFVGEDETGAPLTYQYKLSTHGLSHTTPVFSALTTATASGLAGTATGDTLTVQCGIVSSASAANGALTVAQQPIHPSPVFVELSDSDASITALTVTVAYTDARGNAQTDAFTLTNATAIAGGKRWVTTYYASAVASVVVSGLTGTATGDKLRAGLTNGVNNATTADAITFESLRHELLWSQLQVWVAEQGRSAGFGAADMIDCSGIELTVDANLDARVTSRFGDRIEEPTPGGAGWPMVSVKFSFSARKLRSRRLLRDLLSQAQCRALLQFTGPFVPTTTTAQTVSVWLNGLQLQGNVDWSDAGANGFELTAEAAFVTATPTAFPSAAPLHVRIVNGQSTSMA